MERVITAIRVQQRNHQRVNIDLDGEFAFGLSRIASAWLNVGDQISEEKIEQLKAKDTDEVAFQVALRLLNRRLKTEKEMTASLQSKGFQPDQVVKVILRLKTERLLDDTRFSQSWIESRSHFHPRSHRLLRYELRQKGIAEDLIDDALAESPAESDLAYQAASRYARRLEVQEWNVFRDRLCAYLGRRGFSFSSSLPVVTTLWNELMQVEGKSGENEGI